MMNGIFEELLSSLPGNMHFSVEFRDSSWIRSETFHMLDKYDVAYTIVDEPLIPPICEVTASFSYIPRHGRGSKPWYYYRYSNEELREWIPKIMEIAKSCETIYGYFNNHFNGYACESALKLLDLLGIISDFQTKVKMRMERSILNIKPPIYDKSKLESYTYISSDDPSILVKFFTDAGRIRRAENISDEDVSFDILSESLVKGKVKDYIVIVDLKNKIIIHNCPDFSRVSVNKQFCKHLVKFFSLMRRKLSVKILRIL